MIGDILDISNNRGKIVYIPEVMGIFLGYIMDILIKTLGI
jgi:hypothetical protein